MIAEIHLLINYKSNVTPVNARHLETMRGDVGTLHYSQRTPNWAMSAPNIRKSSIFGKPGKSHSRYPKN